MSGNVSMFASLSGNVPMFDDNKIKLNKKSKQFVIQSLCYMAAADAAAEATAATAVAVATEAAAATKGVGATEGARPAQQWHAINRDRVPYPT